MPYLLQILIYVSIISILLNNLVVHISVVFVNYN